MTAPVILLGKLGHGKTCLLNKLTGKHFPSHMGAKSCTRTVQFGHTHRYSIPVVDTPGFCASEDIARHIAAQKLALEGHKVAGIYVVIKYARADEISEMVQNIMNFVGDDDVRVIITHSDVAENQEGYDVQVMRECVSELLDLDLQKITVIGKDTQALTIEGFIQATLHEPREIKISPEQISVISALSIGARRVTKEIDEVYAKIAVASKECCDMIEGGKDYETDVAIVVNQNATTMMVRDSKEEIFRNAEGLNMEQQNLVYGKAGLALSLRLHEFMDVTNKNLSWDVSNSSDPRNVYKSCPYCGAVFNKTEGCDGQTTCGAVPADHKRSNAKFVSRFRSCGPKSWGMYYIYDGTEIVGCKALRSHLRGINWNVLAWGGGKNHQKRSGAVFESGCGAHVDWSTMIPVAPALVASLGNVELERGGETETVSRVNFDERVSQFEQDNKAILDGAFSG